MATCLFTALPTIARRVFLSLQDQTPLVLAAYYGHSEFLSAYYRRDYRALASLCGCDALTLIRNCLSPARRAAHDARATVLLFCDQLDRTHQLAPKSAANLSSLITELPIELRRELVQYL